MLVFSPLIERITDELPLDVPVYLVGGAVRDALLGRTSYDLDFALPAGAMSVARRLADRIGAAYFPMDTERDIARVVIVEPGTSQQDEKRYKLDFAAFQGPDLESDLRKRDCTINAMAVELRHPQALIDPLGGAADLAAKQLKPCSATSFLDDPVRIMRAVRQATDYGLKITPDSLALMRQAAPYLSQVSAERLRDELFRILAGPQPATSLRLLDILSALDYVLPELGALKGVEQGPPHVLDVWNHTLDVLYRLEMVLEALAPDYDPDKAANLALGLLVLRLGRYRQNISEHLRTRINPDRKLRELLFLAALYHDVAKPQTRRLDDKGQVRFFEHEELGARAVEDCGQALRMNNAEVDRLKTIVRHHMRPMLLANLKQAPSSRAIYRFFRSTGPAGVDICLHSLADVLATYGPTLPQDKWSQHLDVVRALLEAWWDKPEESIAPRPLLSGHDLMSHLGIEPGPQVGSLLEAIREAQAVGQVHSREQALELARMLLLK